MSTVDLNEFALLLVDVQKDFWTEEMTIAFPEFETNIEKLLGYCRGEGVDVIHLRARFNPDRSDWMVKYLMLDQIPCVDGTEGAEVFGSAIEAPGETVIYKQTFDGFHNPDLAQHLADGGKRYLLVAGLVTSVCVLLTSAAAAQRGFLVSVVEDCCADKPEAHVHTLERYPFVFEPVSVDDIAANVERWSNAISSLPRR